MRYSRQDSEEEIVMTNVVSGTSAELRVEYQENAQEERLILGKEDSVHYQQSNSGLFGSSFNFINSIVGAGIIGLPLAIYRCGFVFGLILITFVAGATLYSVQILVEAGILKKKLNYEEVGEAMLGTYGFYMITNFMFLMAFGAMIAYHIVIGDTIPPVVEEYIDESSLLARRDFCVFAYSVCFMLPLSLLRDMSSLKYSSFVSIAAVCVILLCVLLESKPQAREAGIDEQNYNFISINALAGIGTMSFAFTCQHSSFLVYQSMKKQSAHDWWRVNFLSVFTAYVLCMLMALGGYCAFQSQVEGDILNNFNYTNDFANVARILLALTMVFTYPMESYVARHCLYTLLFERLFNRRTSCCYRLSKLDPRMVLPFISLVLWIVAVAIGANVQKLGPVLELTGAFGASLLSYVFPCLIHLRAHGFYELKDKSTKAWHSKDMSLRSRCHAYMSFWFALGLTVFGIFACVLGTANVIYLEA